ncbi:hypothetical protein PGT21_021480 [Puccinia graminis f. sp. tritici]|uniref:Uncharacterized protein n=1 Tax=Puccinia graminis f. sp. tritici TaxID=56615 RepID=A0A5B0RGL6_PUCGR|nr:hypothetical protein PGT21_021480 [Puccinia graminis f. sp. tritici]KAA1124539.1 hypothetical protein PGTUg99_011608 [Puccinia graminis f. sp. tritici]
MQFLAALTLVTLLVSFPFATQSADFSNDYIIKWDVDRSKSYLEVKSANGKVAYTFSRTYNLPTQGQSTVITGDSTFKKLFSLVSSNDAPLPKTQYVQVDGPNAKDNLPKRQYKFDNSRIFRNMLWRFNFYYDVAGARIYYKFERNMTNKGGRIYK